MADRKPTLEEVTTIVREMVRNKKVHDSMEYPNYEQEKDVRVLAAYFDLDYDEVDMDVY